VFHPWPKNRIRVIRLIRGSAGFRFRPKAGLGNPWLINPWLEFYH